MVCINVDSKHSTFIPDVDECVLDPDSCHPNATCTNTLGSFVCNCITGFAGDGMNCTDINECASELDNDCEAEERAECINTVGSFYCQCNPGYAGDGVICMGELCMPSAGSKQAFASLSGNTYIACCLQLMYCLHQYVCNQKKWLST